MVGRQCGPILLNRSESTIRGPLHVSRPGQLGYLGSVSPQFFSSPLKLRCVHKRIRAACLSTLLQRKKCRGQISKTEPTWLTRLIYREPETMRNNYCHISPTLWYHYLAHSILLWKTRRTIKGKKTTLLNTSWIQYGHCKICCNIDDP